MAFKLLEAVLVHYANEKERYLPGTVACLLYQGEDGKFYSRVATDDPKHKSDSWNRVWYATTNLQTLLSEWRHNCMPEFADRSLRSMDFGGFHVFNHNSRSHRHGTWALYQEEAMPTPDWDTLLNLLDKDFPSVTDTIRRQQKHFRFRVIEAVRTKVNGGTQSSLLCQYEDGMYHCVSNYFRPAIWPSTTDKETALRTFRDGHMSSYAANKLTGKPDGGFHYIDRNLDEGGSLSLTSWKLEEGPDKCLLELEGFIKDISQANVLVERKLREHFNMPSVPPDTKAKGKGKTKVPPPSIPPPVQDKEEMPRKLVGLSLVDEGGGDWHSAILVWQLMDGTWQATISGPAKCPIVTPITAETEDGLKNQLALIKRQWEKVAAANALCDNPLSKIRLQEGPLFRPDFSIFDDRAFHNGKQVTIEEAIATLKIRWPKQAQQVEGATIRSIPAAPITNQLHNSMQDGTLLTFDGKNWVATPSWTGVNDELSERISELEHNLKEAEARLIEQLHEKLNTLEKERTQQAMPINIPPKEPMPKEVDRMAGLSPGERTILEKYKDEAQAAEMEAGLKELQKVQHDLKLELKKRDQELRMVKRGRKKGAAVVQTMGLSALATVLVYFILSRVFQRPIPTLELADPSRMVRRGRKRKRARSYDDQPPVASGLALPPGAPPFEEPVKTRTRSKATR